MPFSTITAIAMRGASGRRKCYIDRMVAVDGQYMFRVVFLALFDANHLGGAGLGGNQIGRSNVRSNCGATGAGNIHHCGHHDLQIRRTELDLVHYLRRYDTTLTGAAIDNCLHQLRPINSTSIGQRSRSNRQL